MIELREITKEYWSKKEKNIAVDNVSLTVNEGEVFGIVGYSGAGKSTLLRFINLLERPTTGSVRVDGIDLLTLSNKELRKTRQSIGMIFQGFYLVASKTVFENVAFALLAAGVQKKHIRDKVVQLLEVVGLSDQLAKYPSQLSGGQKQRVSIARSLANDPKILLCDEATSALDPNTTESILSLLKEINQKLGITIVVITHEMEVVKEICHRCAVMREGKVVELGTTFDIFSAPKDPLTKKFIQNVLEFEIPELMMNRVKGKLVKLIFLRDLATDAVVSDMIQAFEVRANILHGKVEYIHETPLGVFIMDISGEEDQVNQAIDYLHKRVHKVEVIEDGPTYRALA
ncbi:methionine ABC transporter ATP-binding protein [Guptibacillus hwajinpoensis]|uniref:Methionine ABC transporter ATP-binding protein n=1 Tax=Guptibacillus hwajinpoensis TaxID=208199 RepID=A0A0J6CS64_9BACL|nr:ATP-binding cassette domain-containing protein [Alkalihalobacillus macyae]KMM35955.1 methionine ABC transporter ATP-binding protein [Alkalihalobacillus macyae]